MRRLDLRHVDLHPETGPIGNGNHAAHNLQRLLRQALSVLPDPVRIDRGDLARRGRGDMREHRQRNVEMVVGMRSPGQAPLAAHLGNADRALHRPEMRVGERKYRTAWSWIAWPITQK